MNALRRLAHAFLLLASAVAPVTRAEEPEPPRKTNAPVAMFDGKTLSGWKITEFAGKGEVRVEKGEIQFAAGESLTGITWTNPVPAGPYEITLEAMKIEGGDFFCGLTFPFEKAHASFIIGGWGGSVVGISSIDGQSASENDTTRHLGFDKNKWYVIRLRVTRGRIEAWIDKEKMVDLETQGHRIGMRTGEIELNVPLGIATWQTSAAFRNLRLVELPAAK